MPLAAAPALRWSCALRSVSANSDANPLTAVQGCCARELVDSPHLSPHRALPPLDADELAPAATTLIVRETTLVRDSVNSNASKSALRAAIRPEALLIGLFLPFLGRRP